MKIGCKTTASMANGGDSKDKRRDGEEEAAARDGVEGNNLEERNAQVIMQTVGRGRGHEERIMVNKNTEGICEGEGWRGTSDWAGWIEGDVLRTAQRIDGGSTGWQRMQGIGAEGQGMIGRGQGRGGECGGESGGAGWHRGQELLRASVGVQQAQGQIHRGELGGGRADPGWFGGQVLQGRRVRGHDGKGQEFGHEWGVITQIGPGQDGVEVGGSERQTLKRSRGETTGEKDGRTVKGKKKRVDEEADESDANGSVVAGSKCNS